VLAVTAACTSTTSTVVTTGDSPISRGSLTGASSSRSAVDAFFKSIKDGDVQATSSVWGSKSGAARDWMARESMEPRIVVMQCYLAHEGAKIVANPRASNDSAVFRVELTRGAKTEPSDVVTVAGPRSRWYVASATFPPVAGCVFPNAK
jgi:hypothetical protein